MTKKAVRDASGTVTAENLTASRCSTLLRAGRADSGDYDEAFRKGGTLKLTGNVHLEVDGAVLDSPTATIVLAEGRIHSVNVETERTSSSQKKVPVHVEFNGAVLDVDTAAVAFADGRMKTIEAVGAPAQFSYRVKKSGRLVRGSAARIDYDAEKTLIRFRDASYSYDEYKNDTRILTHNFNDGSTTTEDAKTTFLPDERVPAPSTPDRKSAK